MEAPAEFIDQIWLQAGKHVHGEDANPGRDSAARHSWERLRLVGIGIIVILVRIGDGEPFRGSEIMIDFEIELRARKRLRPLPCVTGGVQSVSGSEIVR